MHPTRSILEFSIELNVANKNDEAIKLLLWFYQYKSNNGTLHSYLIAIAEEAGEIELALKHNKLALDLLLLIRTKKVIKRSLAELLSEKK